MPSNTQNYSLPIYDIWSELDGQERVGQALDDVFGIKQGSGMRLIDAAIWGHEGRLTTLSSRIDTILDNEFKIFAVNLQYQSSSSTETNSVYTGTSSEFSDFKTGYIYLFSFDRENVGSVQFNINTIGFYSLLKVNSGVITDLETNDLRQQVKYLAFFNGTRFVLIGDNFNTEMKKYDPIFELGTIEHELNRYPSAQLYRTTWAAGIGGVGEGPAGGTSLVLLNSNAMQIPGSVEQLDKNRIKIFSTQEYKTYTEIQKISDTEYVLIAPDSDETSISLVLLLF